MQWRAAICILDAFCTSFTEEIKALARLIPIYLHLNKLSSRAQLRVSSLLFNHTIWSLLEIQYSIYSTSHYLSIENMTSKQRLKIKSSITDVNIYLNGLILSFDSLNSEFSPRFRLIDKFHSQYSLYWVNHKNKESKKAHLCKLNNLFSNLMVNPNTTIVISDTSIKNSIATSVTHIYLYMEQVKKTISSYS